jgi:hypothetical protein
MGFSEFRNLAVTSWCCVAALVSQPINLEANYYEDGYVRIVVVPPDSHHEILRFMSAFKSQIMVLGYWV